MENSIQWHIPTENVNNSVASPILRTEVNINDDDLSQEAKAQFGYHTEILHAFRLNARNVLANDGLSPIGRHLFCINLEKDYMNCKRVLNYVAKNMQLKRTVGLLPPTFFICGLPRTGSTLLFNLLACDPLCRAPLATDLFYPVPPLARSDTTGQAQRIIEVSKSSEIFRAVGLNDYERQLLASHPRYAHEEDLFLFYHVGISLFNTLLTSPDNTELLEWFFNDTNKNFAYEYHKTFLQMLNNVDTPRSHWILKSPIHTFFLDTLLRHYPSASFIMTHRRLDEVLPSYAG
ncbi:unnamed protein product [Rotaria sp. Silwood1]|nr:unnamed protein product [Rotaria sp. Silwood1]